MKVRMMPKIELRPPLDKIEVTSPFGRRTSPITGRPEGHPGVDLRAAEGTPIYAAADGQVIHSYFSNPKPPLLSYGNRIVISHGDGIETSYAHLINRKAMAGQKVKAGDLIGWAGNTGASKGAHLHFELKLDGVERDPMPYLLTNKVN